MALAGPASNIVLAVIMAAAAVGTLHALPAVSEFFAHGVWLSLYLALFNLMPVPPLDGSKLLLAARVPVAVYNELARAGFLIMVVAISVSDVGRWMSQWSWVGARAIFMLFRA